MKVELTEGETLAFFSLVESALASMSWPRTSAFLPTTSGLDSESSSVSEATEATVTPFEPRVVEPSVEAGSAEPAPVALSPEAIEAQRLKALHGRDVWLALIEMWCENFGIDNAPQPDRAAVLVRLLHMDGIAIFSFLRTKAGLTDATRDVLCELRRRPLDNALKREARLLAENIAQVCSFYVPALAGLLEYTAEFHIIPE